MTRTPKHPRPASDVETRVSEYDQYAASPAGRAGLAAAAACLDAQALLERAFEASPLSAREVAAALDISDGRISQIRHGDGNVKLATLARVLDALGLRLELTAKAQSDTAPSAARTASEELESKVPTAVWVQDFVDSSGVYKHSYTTPAAMSACIPVGAPRSRTSDSEWRALAHEKHRAVVGAGVDK